MGHSEGIMSSPEKNFVQKYLQLWENHMKSNVTNHLPLHFQDLLHQIKTKAGTPPNMIPRPGLNRHVIFRALYDIDDIIDENEGSQLKGIMRVKFLLENFV